MNGRERVNAILHKRPADRLSWTTEVDHLTLDALPEGWRGISSFDFCRRIGCDIFHLMNGRSFRSPAQQWGGKVNCVSYCENGREVILWETPKKTLFSVYDGVHPIKYPVATLQDVRIYREMWEGATYIEQDDRPALQALDREIGEDGIATWFWGPSCIPLLLENVMGIENFYYLLNDHPDDMTALIELMHQRELEAFTILARHPCEVITLCENTSTHYISPDIYRRYNGPHQRDFVEIMHRNGKVAMLHMCGHVKDILAEIKKTGMDGIHALTPPPTGNTPWELALDAWGDDTIIIGVFDSNTFLVEPLENIPAALDRLYTPRLRRANFILALPGDGLQVPLARFEAVARWMEKQHGTATRRTARRNDGNEKLPCHAKPQADNATPEGGSMAKPTTCKLSDSWQMFGPLDREDKIDVTQLRQAPEFLTAAGRRWPRRAIAPHEWQLDLASLLGGAEEGKTAWVFIPFTVEQTGNVAFGIGADWWFEAFVDGEPLLDTLATGNKYASPSCDDHRREMELVAGEHLLTVRVISGSAGFCLRVAAGTTAEINVIASGLRQRRKEALPQEVRVFLDGLNTP
jgi:hypothetical protein